MERKLTEEVVITNVDEAQGIVEAIWAVMGNVDDGNDIIHPGAFTKTFNERGNQIKLLDNHRTDSVLNALGVIKGLRELSPAELPAEIRQRHPDATGGASGQFQFLLDTPEGKGAFTRIQKGAVKGWSFGYDAVDKDHTTVTKDGQDITVRNLRGLKLYEISPVLFPMNEATGTLSAKQAEAESEQDNEPDEEKAADTILEAINALTAALQAAGLLNTETDNAAPIDETENNGPLESNPPPTSDDHEAGPTIDDADTRLINLIDIELEELEV
jgi:HK97 family phage prohead protease